jgi:hypothetical protein
VSRQKAINQLKNKYIIKMLFTKSTAKRSIGATVDFGVEAEDGASLESNPSGIVGIGGHSNPPARRSVGTALGTGVLMTVLMEGSTADGGGAVAEDAEVAVADDAERAVVDAAEGAVADKALADGTVVADKGAGVTTEAEEAVAKPVLVVGVVPARLRKKHYFTHNHRYVTH